MGRATLILVIMMSTLFAGLTMRMNTNMLKLPDLLTEHQIKREAENISDYSLREAIDIGSDRAQAWYDAGYENVYIWYMGNSTETGVPSVNPKTGAKELDIYTANFPVANGSIKKISFMKIAIIGGPKEEPAKGNGNVTIPDKRISFQAITEVQSHLQNKTYDYKAQIAFNFYATKTPNCFYYEMNNNINGNSAKKRVQDSSGNDNLGYDTLHTHSKKNDGVAGTTCTIFRNHHDCTIYCPDAPSLRVSAAFTLVGFVKVDDSSIGNSAALIWLPTLPGNGISPNPPPTAGIWIDSDSYMHFTVGGLSGEEDPLYSQADVSFDYKPHYTSNQGNGNSPNYKGPWDFVALSFENGELTGYYAYIDDKGETVWNVFNADKAKFDVALLSEDGFSVGGKITKIVKGTQHNPYEFSSYEWALKGAMDQVGMYNRALTYQEVINFYNLTTQPATIDYIREGWGKIAQN